MDGKIEAALAGGNISVLEDEITRLETAHRDTEAKLEKTRQENNAQIEEFNAGFVAAKTDKPESAEPDTEHDQWMPGYAWGRYDVLKADNTRLRASLAAAEELVENLKGALADLSCACQAGGMPDELEQAMRAALLKAEALLRPKQDSEGPMPAPVYDPRPLHNGSASTT